MKPRTVVIGAVWSTETALQALAAADHLPQMLLTLPLEKARRHSDFVDLGPLGETLGVPVMRIDDVNHPQVLTMLAELRPDIVFVIGWSQLCGRDFLRIARIGTLGYHPTLLPKMRGRAALAWTILLGPKKTGGTLFWIDDGMDSGEIAAQSSFSLSGTEHLSDLILLHRQALARMIPPLFSRIASGERPATAQDHSQATFAAIRRAADGEIDWSRPANEIDRLVRSVSRPYPGAFTHLSTRKLVIWSADVVHYPQWHAQVGQIFTYEEHVPVVRCGKGTDLALSEIEWVTGEESGPSHGSQIRGQPRLGLRR